MAKRIYTYYGIKIIDENGENFIKLNGNVNTSSYSEMKKSYHKAKMKNKDRNCKVQLIGLFSNGEEGAIIYEKEFKKIITSQKFKEEICQYNKKCLSL